MTADELYAWEVENLPHLAATWGLPAMAVFAALGALRWGLRFQQGFRAGRRSQYENAGLDPADYGW
jgi:hypothetical protein